MTSAHAFSNEEVEELLAIKRLLEMASSNVEEIGAPTVSELISAAVFELSTTIERNHTRRRLLS